MAGLRNDCITAPLVIDGPMNGAIFMAWLQQSLVPTLTLGDTVIMDNLPAHKVSGVRAIIEPELKDRRRLHGGTKSVDDVRVKAASRDSGGAKAPVLRRESATDTIKTSKSHLTQKTVAHIRVG